MRKCKWSFKSEHVLECIPAYFVIEKDYKCENITYAQNYLNYAHYTRKYLSEIKTLGVDIHLISIIKYGWITLRYGF